MKARASGRRGPYGNAIPRRPGTAPAHGLRAAEVAVAIVTQANLEKEIQQCDFSLGLMA
jgi:hypothetical protein